MFMLKPWRAQTPAPELEVRRVPLSPRRFEAIVGFLFILPWLLGFILLKAVPILAALGFSFTDFNMLNPEEMKFVGLGNYITFLSDRSAGASLFGSVETFLLFVPLEMFVSLALATIFASERLRGKALLRTLFFMPSIIPAIAIFIIISGLTYPNSGWLSRLTAQAQNLPPWLDSIIGPSLSIMNFGSLIGPILALWSIGPGFLIMLGAIQSIPKEIIEAARVDGAGPLNRFLSITIPMISPAIFFSLVINTISAFGGVALLDRGLPFSQSLSPMEGYIAFNMFSLSHLGYASALAWVMFLVVMVVTILLFRSAKYWVHFPEEEDNEEI
jgi:ABC-type sugar transport system permease subunit